MSEINKQMEIRDLVDNTHMKEKLQDLKNWEKTMKNAEKEIKRQEPEELPPIRSRLLKENKTDNATSEKQSDESEQQGKFKCKLEINSGETKFVEDEQTKNQRMANLEKERGNKCVKQQELGRAIIHYSTAIELNPKDPIFFTNRAFCYLKQEKFKKAIEDCDGALALNRHLPKAHYRRMLANEGLENYDQALRDCMEQIKIESNNPTLRKDFDRIKKLKLAKDRRTKELETPKWEPKLQKLWSKFGPDEQEITFQDKAPHLRSKKSLRRLQVSSSYSEPEPIEKFPDYIVDKLFSNFTGESTSNPPTPSSPSAGSSLYNSLGSLYGSFNMSKATAGPSSNQAVPLNLTKSPDRSIDDIFEGKAPKPTRPETLKLDNLLPKASSNSNVIDVPELPATAAEESPKPQQYEIPKTGVQFFSAWKDLNEFQRSSYLKQIVSSNSNIIRNLGPTLDSRLLSEILFVLQNDFCPKNLPVSGILADLIGNNEIVILSLMLSEEDRHRIEQLKIYSESRKETDSFADIARIFSV